MNAWSYLVDAAGFFLQLYPCALLCFLPADDDRLRVSRRQGFLALTLTALVLAAVFPMIVYLPNWRNAASQKMAANVYMLLTAALMVTAYGAFVRENLEKKLLVAYVVVLYAMLVYWLSNVIDTLTDFVWQAGVSNIYTPYFLAFYLLALAVLFPPVCLFMCRVVAVFLREIEPRSIRREFACATFSTAGLLVLLMLSDPTRQMKLDMIGGFILFLMLNEALFYWMVFTGAVHRSREEKTRRTLEVQRLQYDRISADMEQTARQRHDMRHHWNYLYSLTESGDLEGVRSYLASLVSRTDHRESETFCKDPTVNALLQYYIGIARDQGIVCTVAARCGKLDILPEDLTVLIGNALENAVNACARAEGDRFINVAVGLLHGSFTLEVTNSCSGVKLARAYKDSDGFLPAAAFLSTRDGGGRGLTGIADLAKKYSGSAVFRYDGDAHTFTTRIILDRVREVWEKDR